MAHTKLELAAHAFHEMLERNVMPMEEPSTREDEYLVKILVDESIAEEFLQKIKAFRTALKEAGLSVKGD